MKIDWAGIVAILFGSIITIALLRFFHLGSGIGGLFGAAIILFWKRKEIFQKKI